MKTYTHFDSLKQPIHLLKTHEKMCIIVSNFYMKITNNKHTLLYNLTTIHLI